MQRKILSSRETVKLDSTGQLQRWRVVEYMLDDLGPFTFEAPKSEFTYAKLREDMAREEEGLKSVAGE